MISKKHTVFLPINELHSLVTRILVTTADSDTCKAIVTNDGISEK